MKEEIREKLQKEEQPSWVAPQLATLTHEHFSSPDWIYERKLDGERCIIHQKDGELSIYTRNKKKINATYPELIEPLKALTDKDYVIDGEVVAFEDTTTSFAKLQNRIHVKKPSEDLINKIPVYCYIFDILYYDGYDVMSLDEKERKELLKSEFNFKSKIKYTEHRAESGEKFLREACEKGWEGLIAKKADEPYKETRTKNWLKFKCSRGQEFVIGGYTQPKGERKGFGALLIGYYEGDKLKYAGKVGTGYDDKFLKEFGSDLHKIKRKTSPFDNYDESRKEVVWVTPEYVGEVDFTEWTRNNKLRHPRFKGLRRDKKAKDVVKEEK